MKCIKAFQTFEVIQHHINEYFWANGFQNKDNNVVFVSFLKTFRLIIYAANSKQLLETSWSNIRAHYLKVKFISYYSYVLMQDKNLCKFREAHFRAVDSIK